MIGGRRRLPDRLVRRLQRRRQPRPLAGLRAVPQVRDEKLGAHPRAADRSCRQTRRARPAAARRRAFPAGLRAMSRLARWTVDAGRPQHAAAAVGPEGTRADLEGSELFWIVKNGLKYTGMPPWPTQQRDDEVWDVIGFLRELPTMSRSAIASWPASRDDEGTERRSPTRQLAGCAHCHATTATVGDRGLPASRHPDRALSARSAESLCRVARAPAVSCRRPPRNSRRGRWRGSPSTTRTRGLPPPLRRRRSRRDAGRSALPSGRARAGRAGLCRVSWRKAADRDPPYPALLGQHAALHEDATRALQARRTQRDRSGAADDHDRRAA